MLSKMKLWVMLDVALVFAKTGKVLTNMGLAMGRTAQEINNKCWDIIFEDNDMEMAERMPDDNF